MPLSIRVASSTVVGSGVECGRPNTATGPPEDDAAVLLVGALLLVAGLLLEVLDAAVLGGADELVTAAVEDAGLAVPPMPAQALAAASTSTAAELAPISLR